MKSLDLSHEAELWKHGAMYPSEIQFFAEEAAAAKADLVIECGCMDAVSTFALARLFANTLIQLKSVDFRFDKRLSAGRLETLQRLGVELVPGDVHRKVPEMLAAFPGRRIAILQDAAKGWEGLSALFAAASFDHVHVIAQHNLHQGHSSRKFVEQLVPNGAFLEDHGSSRVKALRRGEAQSEIARKSQRPMDHSSLGVINFTRDDREAFLARMRAGDQKMGPWSAVTTCSRWRAGDYDHLIRLRAEQDRRGEEFQPR